MTDHAARNSASLPIARAVADSKMNFVAFLGRDSATIPGDVAVDHSLQYIDWAD